MLAFSAGGAGSADTAARQARYKRVARTPIRAVPGPACRHGGRLLPQTPAGLPRPNPPAQPHAVLAMTAVQSGVVSFGCAVLALTVARSQWQPLPAFAGYERFWMIVMYLVAGCTLLAFFVQNYVCNRHDPTQSSLYRLSRLRRRQSNRRCGKPAASRNNRRKAPRNRGGASPLPNEGRRRTLVA